MSLSNSNSDFRIWPLFSEFSLCFAQAGTFERGACFWQGLHHLNLKCGINEMLTPYTTQIAESMLSHKQRFGDPVVLPQLSDQLDPLMKFNIFRKHQELQKRLMKQEQLH